MKCMVVGCNKDAEYSTEFKISSLKDKIEVDLCEVHYLEPFGKRPKDIQKKLLKIAKLAPLVRD